MATVVTPTVVQGRNFGDLSAGMAAFVGQIKEKRKNEETAQILAKYAALDLNDPTTSAQMAADLTRVGQNPVDVQRITQGLSSVQRDKANRSMVASILDAEGASGVTSTGEPVKQSPMIAAVQGGADPQFAQSLYNMQQNLRLSNRADLRAERGSNREDEQFDFTKRVTTERLGNEGAQLALAKQAEARQAQGQAFSQGMETRRLALQEKGQAEGVRQFEATHGLNVDRFDWSKSMDEASAKRADQQVQQGWTRIAMDEKQHQDLINYRNEQLRQNKAEQDLRLKTYERQVEKDNRDTNSTLLALRANGINVTPEIANYVNNNTKQAYEEVAKTFGQFSDGAITFNSDANRVKHEIARANVVRYLAEGMDPGKAATQATSFANEYYEKGYLIAPIAEQGYGASVRYLMEKHSFNADEAKSYVIKKFESDAQRLPGEEARNIINGKQLVTDPVTKREVTFESLWSRTPAQRQAFQALKKASSNYSADAQVLHPMSSMMIGLTQLYNPMATPGGR